MTIRRAFVLAPLLLVTLLLVTSGALSARTVPVAGGPVAVPASAKSTAPAPGDWPMYLHDEVRSGANLVDRSLNVSDVPYLAKVWSFATNGTIAASPIIVRGTVYVGSWDGYEYAVNSSTGAELWATFLGTTSNPKCVPANLGVTSTASWEHGVLYVGGGDGYWYALNAANGSILWRLFLGNSSSYYNWGSPLIAGSHAYVGLASDCDAPLIRGALLEISLTTHKVLHTFYTEAPGQRGASIWSSPVYDARTNSVFVTTGNGVMANQPYAQAFLSLNASTLALQGSWKVPVNTTGVDSDFGTTPTFIPGAHGMPLLVATNKNGLAYALARSNVTAGPVWTTRIAAGGPCPQCGDGSASSGAYANKTLFLAGGEVTLGGTNYSGSIQALWPSNGTIRWQDGLNAPVIPALGYDNGVVVAGVGKSVRGFNAATGAQLFNFSTHGVIYGPAAIAHGCVFFGSTDGHVYALGLAPLNCSVPSLASVGHHASRTAHLGAGGEEGSPTGAGAFAPSAQAAAPPRRRHPARFAPLRRGLG